ncbi:hypothetical protein BHM03_00044061 [Ensete ventricosum]|nr:hypothetical protein BHM03_00044061 [Ensete ventricosum]
MGIIKLRPQRPGNDHRLLRSCFIILQNYDTDELEKTLGDDSDDCELGEVGYEYVMVGGQICGIPYELYELPDLKEILSIETWNYYLNEDERFSLAASLPDMSQETVWLAIKELLTDVDVFFGSPLEKFYNGLRGGLYSPQVTHLREGIHFLQRNEYYHSLRSYHENLSQVFVEMKEVWNKCRPTTSIEGRVQIWNSRKGNNPVFGVDLNTFPDEGTLKKGDSNDRIAETVPLSKKIKMYMNQSHDSKDLVSGLVCSTKRKAKGFLKLKPTVMNSVPIQVMQALPDKSGEPSMRLPKGVLKIKPRYDPLREEKLRPKPEQISVDNRGTCVPQVLPPQFAFKRDNLNLSKSLSFSHQIDRDGRTYRDTENKQDRQRNEDLYTGSGSVDYSESERFQRKPKMIINWRPDDVEICKEWFPSQTNQNLRIYPQEDGHFRECQGKKNSWNSWNIQPNRSLCESLADPKKESFKHGLENYQEKKPSALISEACFGMSNNCTHQHEILTKSSDHLDHECKDNGAVNVAVSGVKEGLMLPITYKRRKPQRKLNQVNSVKQQQPNVVSLEAAAPGGIIKPKRMAIKIKFSGLTGYNA